MQLRAVVLALVLAIGAGTDVSAQSLSPMRAHGPTPSDIKGFRLRVGNPYPGPMVFDIVPMDPQFRFAVGDAVAQPNRVVLAPNATRSVIVAFKIDADKKERTIGLCVVPANLSGNILPRVCGTYRGTKLAGTGR